MLLNNLLDALNNMELFNKPQGEIEVSSIVNDTRKVIENSCFIAIRGENFDGHSALQEVAEKGAVLAIVEEIPDNVSQYPMTFVKVKSTSRTQAILANKFFQEPSTKLNVVAVTGTNGKTTTSHMISQLLEANERKTGLIGTIHYKVANRYYPAPNTTPNSVDLQSMFAEMVKANCDDAIIEASSHALVLGRLAFTEVACAIFTNISREHLDFHQTMEQYTSAKSLLFSQLGQKFHKGKPKLAIINADDPASEAMIEATSAEIVTYSLKSQKATIYAQNILASKGKTKFDLVYNKQSFKVILPMRGTYNVANFLAAFLCLNIYFKISPEDILSALEEFKGVPGRMQAIHLDQPYEVIIDFAHTTDALERVLKELSDKKHPNQKLITLMGHSGGNRDSGARPALGDILFNYSDEIILTADNPRFESVKKIASEMIGEHEEKPYTIIEDRVEAIKYVIENADDNDIILFAGKGGESYQVIGNENVPYNEVQVVSEFIQQNQNK